MSGPTGFKFLRGEVEELFEAVHQGDVAEIRDELSDVGVAAQLWLYHSLKGRANWPLLWGAHAADKYEHRIDGWQRIFAAAGLGFDVKYLKFGSNFAKPQKVFTAIAIGYHDQN